MHTVGDVSDGNLGFRNTFPNAVPHAPGNFAVQFTDAVAETGQTERQYGHAEILGVIGWILAAQTEELNRRNSQTLHVLSEVVFD